jgi:hypothetical protein
VSYRECVHYKHLARMFAPGAASSRPVAVGVDPSEVASLFTAQLEAALQFEMEEVFGMTDEGLRGRMLMLQHAKAQGFAPKNTDKLLMFLRLELQERAAGRVIDMDACEDIDVVPPTAMSTPAAICASDEKRCAAVPASKPVVVKAPAFASNHASKGSEAVAPKSAGSSNAQVRTAAGSSLRSEAGVDGWRDRPWNRKKKSSSSEAFSLGDNGHIEV